MRNSTGGVSIESCSACPAGYHCSSEGLSSPSGPCSAGFYCLLTFLLLLPSPFSVQRDTTVQRAHLWPCHVPLESTNQILAQTTAYLVGLVFTVKRLLWVTHGPAHHTHSVQQGQWFPNPVLMGHIHIQTKLGSKKNRNVWPAHQGSFAELVEFKVCVPLVFFVFLEVPNLLHKIPTLLSVSGVSSVQHHVRPVITVQKVQMKLSLVLPIPFGAVQGVPAFMTAYHVHHNIGANLETLSFSLVLLVITVMAYLGVTIMGEQVPGLVLGTPIEPLLEQAARVTAFPAPLVHTATAQGLLISPQNSAHLVTGAVGMGLPSCAQQEPKDPLQELLHLANVNLAQGVLSALILAQQDTPMWKAFPVELVTSARRELQQKSSAEPDHTVDLRLLSLKSVLLVISVQWDLIHITPPNNWGSMPVNTSGLRDSPSSSCSLCRGGTYRPYLSNSLVCLPCPPGYVCPQGTENYKTHPCPRGYVCPAGSSQPKACPPGSFGKLTHAVKNSDCHPCPAGTFNHLEGQKACFPCGSSSTSSPGSSLCTCIGKNRAFQPSDGSCLCRTGFVFYDEQDFRSSSSDSVFDCQPEVNRRCAKGEVRIAASRVCVSPTLHSCNIACGPHGGTLNVEMGICQCERYVSAEELCNMSCLSRLPHLYAQFSSDGQLQLSLKERKDLIWARSVADILGPDIHANNIGKIHLVEFGSEGVFGWIPTEKELILHFLRGPVEVLHVHHRDRRDTKGENKNEWTVLPRIHNPIACISSGDMLFFQLTINHTDRHHSHFPVYQKDHLFNSNPSWDFGAFRQLEILMKKTNLNSTRFAHVFAEPGKYVFVDSAVPEWTLVVVVNEQGTACYPRAAVFQPMTPAQLVKLGIVKQQQLNFLPDWELIAAFLSVFMALVVVLTSTVLVLRPEKSKIIANWKNKPKWRNVGEPFCPLECNCTKDSPDTPSLALVLGNRGVGEGAEAEEPAITKGSVSSRCDLEEFNVKTLYDKLEDQNLHIASQLARHRKDTQEFYRNMCQQAETLINILDSMDNKKLLLLKELLINRVAKDEVHNSRQEEKQLQDETFAVLLGDVLRSVEALLCKMTIGEVWHHQYVVPQDDCDCEPQHGDANICYTQLSSAHLVKDESLTEPAVPCLSDHDLSTLVSITPLFQTLQDIQQSLQNLTVGQCGLLDTEPDQETGLENAELIVTALDSLSPQHSAIYLFGCQVMQMLSSVPTTLTSAKIIAHCSKYFYFDATNQILYISEDRLHHAGHFISTLLQCMAHIVSGSKTEMFLKALHEAISVLSFQLFRLSLKWKAGSKLDMSEEQQGSLVSEFLNIRTEQLISKLKQSSTEDRDRVHSLTAHGSPVQMFCIEEEIDRLNESFIQLSMQLQNRSQARGDTGESNAGSRLRSASPSSIPSLSRNGTILLELKRRYVSSASMSSKSH
ncbi:hypothetical protein WMY93_028727 [Mugilogobius chulae]|uniref:Uncharacterized protein n=1 Tax=Mugilogobius chulae TaxID=88201 RepID=A0AAW0MVU8_9GOBI